MTVRREGNRSKGCWSHIWKRYALLSLIWRLKSWWECCSLDCSIDRLIDWLFVLLYIRVWAAFLTWHVLSVVSFFLLIQILKNVHPNLVIRSEALSFVESRLAHVLDLLSEQQPHTISEVDDRIRLVFPNGLIPRSISYAREKKQLIIPVTKLHPVIQKEYLPKVLPKDCKAVSTYLCAILQFLASEILRVCLVFHFFLSHFSPLNFCPELKTSIQKIDLKDFSIIFF